MVPNLEMDVDRDKDRLIGSSVIYAIAFVDRDEYLYKYRRPLITMLRSFSSSCNFLVSDP